MERLVSKRLSELTHLDESGAARMVNVGSKAQTDRSATAYGRIRMSKEAIAAIHAGDAPKGDVLGTARIAAIMAAKRTAELIPLCHPLGLDAVEIEFDYGDGSIAVKATASLTGKTGVEMEVMVAVTTALLTIYDMAKALDKGMVIEEVRLLEKKGGKSDHWRAEEPSA
ncbi:MAG TPA: cyclic pyranopterin monophosphate synthase MoaC [Erythrobacter sp.]|nr:cyclic pyranopterin monophosphate synthase MoaC [Erythrobacter sp.]